MMGFWKVILIFLKMDQRMIGIPKSMSAYPNLKIIIFKPIDLSVES